MLQESRGHQGSKTKMVNDVVKTTRNVNTIKQKQRWGKCNRIEVPIENLGNKSECQKTVELEKSLELFHMDHREERKNAWLGKIKEKQLQNSVVLQSSTAWNSDPL